MAMSDVQIANMALSNIGVAQQIANLTTEQSVESNTCALYMQQALEGTLEDFSWPFATAYQAMGKVVDNSAVTTPFDWLYAYRYPSDCLHARRLVTYLGRRDPNPPPFRIGADSQGRLVWTNDTNGILEYTFRIKDYNQLTPLFAEAMSWKLGGFIAPALSRVKGIADKSEVLYLRKLAKAEVEAANEQQQMDLLESEAIRARDGGAGGNIGQRYGSFPAGFIVS